VWDLQTFIRDKNPNALTLPQYFKQNGYETAAIGKVFDPRSVDAAHDSISWTIPYSDITGGRWINAEYKVSTESADVPDERTVDGKMTVRGIELLDQLSKNEKPFFLAIGFKKPHLPFVAPEKYWNLYKRENIKIHPFQKYALHSPDFAYHNSGELRNNYVDIPAEGPIPDEKQKELIHGYYACVSFIDAQVGKLVARLDTLGIRENTIIILWGDHGWHLGDHAMWAKHSNFEQATRSPLIFSAPGISGGIHSNSPTEFLDIFPTLCEFAGLDLPNHLEGVSLLPIMQNPEATVKEYAVSQYKRTSAGISLEGYALRTKRYRYVEWLPEAYKYGTQFYNENDVVARELYDYENDPMETISLIDSSAYKNVVDQMRQYMKEYFQKNATLIKKSQGSINVPHNFELRQNFPNPFNPDTVITYRLQSSANIKLIIYNLQGQKVKMLVDQQLPAGEYFAHWDGLNENSEKISSGIYYCRLASGSEMITKKMTLLE
jgi:arylsulfatase A-like enzyme